MPGWIEDLIDKAPDRDVAERIRTALSRLLKEDAYLLKSDANERSISDRLAIYLAEAFPDWHVDCEYNRDGHEPKRLHLHPEFAELGRRSGTTVYPDIIVHERGQPRNLLALEIKKSSAGSTGRDLFKLRRLRHELGYQYGLFLRFGTGPLAGDISEARWSVD